jgi:hypothetical protein
VTRKELAQRAAELGMPAGGTFRYQRLDRGGGWEMEWIGLRVQEKPERSPWPYHYTRLVGEIGAVHQVWYMAARHGPSGFGLERRWHPDMGEDREWTAVSRNGEFGLLGQARGLFRHSGRRPALRGPEQIRAARARLSRAAGKPPTTSRLARELGITAPTLRSYLHRWPSAQG